MMEKMSKRERVTAAFKGEAVDRPPFAFWGHHYDMEYSLAGHVSSTLWWQRYLDVDILKVQCRASYHGEDWGLRFQYEQASPFVGVNMFYKPPEKVTKSPQLVAPAIKTAKDWETLPLLNPSHGALGERLASVGLIQAGLAQMGEEPLVFETVFSPLGIAARMVGASGGKRLDVMQGYIRDNPEALHKGLQVITTTFRNYVSAILESGADGIFFATTDWASHDLLSSAEYAEFGRQYDLQVLEAMQGSPVILHVCNQQNMLYALLDYPVDAFSWAPSDPGNPTLKAVHREAPARAVMGGLSKTALTESSSDKAVAEAKQAYAETGGVGWICAPDCSVPPECSPANMLAVTKYVRSLAD